MNITTTGVTLTRAEPLKPDAHKRNNSEGKWEDKNLHLGTSNGSFP